MGLFDIFRKARNETVDLNDKKLLEWLGVSEGDYSYKGTGALREATVYACIKILSENMSKLPLKIYQDDNGIKKASNHYLYRILKLRPNPFMSASDYWKTIEAQRSLHGNAYSWLEIPTRGPNKGKIQGIYPLDSSKIKIMVDDLGLVGSRNKIYYIYTDPNGVEYKISDSNILHFKGVTVDGLTGISPINQLEKLVGNAGQSTQFLNNSFKSGMQVKGIINYVGDLNPKAQEMFRNQFESMANGLKNANKVALLPLGYNYTPMSLTMADAQFLENTQLTIRQIASSFGIKMHQLNDLERSTYSNITEQERDFYISTLLPILTMYEQELTYKLFLDSEIENGYYVKFNVDSILRSDIKTRYEAYRIGVQSGFITPNEVREMEERQSLDGGDKLLVNGNMVPIEKAGIAYDKKGGGQTEE